jgi:hypothetical protein
MRHDVCSRSFDRMWPLDVYSRNRDARNSVTAFGHHRGFASNLSTRGISFDIDDDDSALHMP